MIPKKFLAWITAFVSTFVIGLVHAANNNLQSLSEELTQLRAEVENLHAQLESQKQTNRDELQSLAMRRGDLQSQIQRESVSGQKFDEQIAQLTVNLGKGSDKSNFKSVVTEAIENLRTQIRQGLPFQTVKRLAELEKMAKDLNSGLLRPIQAVTKLWSFIEDEIRLSKENGIFRQTINIDGEERLVSVAKIGMVMMFFRTDDGLYGQAVKKNEQWTYKWLLEKGQKTQVETLFASLKKQIRSGYFELPGSPLM